MSERRCEKCGARLSRFNEQPTCHACRQSERDKIIAQLDELRSLPEPPKRVRREAPKTTRPPAHGTITARCLEAMPGTINEISEAVGHPIGKTGRLLTKLVNEGRATVEGDKGNGHTGPRRIYRRVEGAE